MSKATAALRKRFPFDRLQIGEEPTSARDPGLRLCFALSDDDPGATLFASRVEFNAWLRQQPPTGRTREEIVEEIAAERDAWE